MDEHWRPAAAASRTAYSPSQPTSQSPSTSPHYTHRRDVSSISNYTLGDCLGRGAFGSVYRALNWTTGQTVAIKRIQLANIPKSELGEIMFEIDLLKELRHPNIVKYRGSEKTRHHLSVILEYCENGSLQDICKRFGKFPEGLVSVYINQVLQGLAYLHDQGVIHRDIKGANILTTKDGAVKLADFGVATRTGAMSDVAVVGSPYWMAPEVIDQSGATTASDIWSVGCVVIELLQGQPPYHFLDPMPALFRIVQDDCPPLPPDASPVVRDFLQQCFQKDPSLRPSAKRLLKHPWMVSARKQLEQKHSTGSLGKASSHADAVRSVKEWNAVRDADEAAMAQQQRIRKQSLASSSASRPQTLRRVSAQIGQEGDVYGDGNEAVRRSDSQQYADPQATRRRHLSGPSITSLKGATAHTPQQRNPLSDSRARNVAGGVAPRGHNRSASTSATETLKLGNTPSYDSYEPTVRTRDAKQTSRIREAFNTVRLRVSQPLVPRSSLPLPPSDENMNTIRPRTVSMDPSHAARRSNGIVKTAPTSPVVEQPKSKPHAAPHAPPPVVRTQSDIPKRTHSAVSSPIIFEHGNTSLLDRKRITLTRGIDYDDDYSGLFSAADEQRLADRIMSLKEVSGTTKVFRPVDLKGTSSISASNSSRHHRTHQHSASRT